MPGNIVKINGSDDFEWYVGDSKMEEIIAFLNENGSKLETTEETPDETEAKK